MKGYTVLFQSDAMGCDSMTKMVLRPNRAIGHDRSMICDKVKNQAIIEIFQNGSECLSASTELLYQFLSLYAHCLPL